MNSICNAMVGISQTSSSDLNIQDEVGMIRFVQLDAIIIMGNVNIIYFQLSRAMKAKLYKLITTLLIFIQQSQELSCPAPFTSVSSSQTAYCVKCDSTCDTCFDDSLSGCVTCPDDFDLNSNTSYCIPPDTKLIHTVESSYKYYKFVQYGNWTGGAPYDCGITVTVLKPSPLGGTLQVNNYLGSHYGMRVLVSVWWFAGTKDKVVVKALLPNSSQQFTADIAFTAGNMTTSNNSLYCTGSYATNFDSGVFNGASSTYITIQFSSASSDWGIREYVFIEYLCNVTYCKTCTGSSWNNCLTCTDTRRIVYNSNGECRCDTRKNTTFGYFKHPDADYCVWPCPSRPGTGQYYGDLTTQSCVLQCPTNTSNSARDNVMYSDDVSGECVPVCPASITLGTQTKDLYHDVDNRRCVTNCPTAKPYKDIVNRKCVATCPSTYYKYDKDMTCVNVCPTNINIPMYKDDFLGKCVDDCEGADWWADPTTNKCTATCSAANQFQDNSTTRNLCTAVCPSPIYFGDLFTGKCIDHCYGGKFGDTSPASTTPRQCVKKCSGTYFGLLTGNRACVPTCPNQTWAETVNRTCKLLTTDCPTNTYADNYTHSCVAKGGCSLGQFSTTVGTKCVITCPSGTFANSASKHCQTSCSGLYFADSTSNKCVTVCQGPGLYADVGSGNKCVASCNQSTTTKYRDFSTKKCVAICPDDPYTFSDPDAQSCVYNCSAGRYKDDLTTPTDKKCVTNCPSPNWGDNSTGYGQCVRACPENPPLFGDVVDGGFRICVEVCQDLPTGLGLFGDQRPIGSGVDQGYRQCIARCPDGPPSATIDYFAQEDDLRRCVTRCNSSTYGDVVDQVCKLPQLCPDVGDPSTNLCVTLCPASEGTFADDIVSNLCVQTCPVNNTITYYADPVGRRCRDTCTPPRFGNNDTQTCQSNCIDSKSFADAVHPRRFCIKNCTNSLTDLYYRNNYTKVCVVAMSCSTDYFGDNVTKDCVAKCPVNNSAQTWGHQPTKTCVLKCYNSQWGDASTGVPLCVSLCPVLPAKWSYNPTMLCMDVCPAIDGLWGWDYNRSCVTSCIPYPTTPITLVYAYNGTNNNTRRCLQQCPQGFFADYIAKMCWKDPADCSFGWGDDYNNSCTGLCTGPNPWNTFGDNDTHLCTTRCSIGSYADNETGTRICVEVCPGAYDATGVNTNSYDTFGDNNTQACVRRCMMPDTWADWQTHRCQSRCTGDDGGIQTFAAQLIYQPSSTVSQRRCVIALWCPETPDKLFGDNNTRSCVPICYFNSSYTQWADNITRTCIPQCLNFSATPAVSTKQYTQPNGTVIDTRFYGDLSTQSPQCVIICPQAPRMFGLNSSNLCVEECPTDQYGDQTGNRSCVQFCPTDTGVVWFTQINQHICVKRCEDGTWGNYYHGPNDRPHCQVVPLGCEQGWYADNSTNMCVPLCPQSQNYFGDNSTRLCVDRCPTLAAPVVIPASNINMPAGYTYADYQTRICLYRCPHDFGPYGTFGDNNTNTCVFRCPIDTFGDAQTTHRHCVTDCTPGTYADPLSQTCVSECPASPPYFGQSTGWTCVENCPSGTWASATTRTCEATCPPSQFRLTDQRTQCVDVCPSDPDLYGDLQTHDCVTRCDLGTLYPFADPTDRTCKASCTPLFQYNYRCVKLCPSGFYANSTDNCVRAIECDGTTYADNRTTKCINPCTGGSFADTNTKYCVAICPDTYYGDVNVCVQTCQTPGTSKSNITQTCRSTCPNLTYHENSTCKAKCQYGYANDVLGTCAPGCPPNLYADPLTHDCVAICYDNQTNDTHDWFRQTDTGFCVDDCGTKFKDFITGNCQEKCSPGYWGNTHNMTCIPRCITGQYGYQGTNQRTCYHPTVLPGYASTLFGDPVSGQYISVCPTVPQLYFGDGILHECKLVCPAHTGTDYYGDPNTRQCQSTCTNATFYTADPSTYRCQVRCSGGSFRYNDTPICVDICPVGYADLTTSVCVAVCPVWADTFGFVNMTSTERTCMLQCPNNYYAQPVYRTCSSTCDAPLFAYNISHQCVSHCLDSFADASNQRCMDKCHSALYPNADNSTNQCVFRCPSQPDYYADNHVCVYYCTNPLQFADPDTRSCVGRCPNTTTPSAITYGDPTTGRCVQKCPLGYFADNTTNKCVKVCPGLSFGYNGTRTCVDVCPSSQKLYGDPFTHMCAFTCSHNYYGSQVNQQCISTCDAPNYWGDPLSTLCVTTCPGVMYLYGQNDTRTCVASCVGYSGFADNKTRICRDVCQNLTTWLTFADPTTMSCVEMCPDGYFMENTTNQCREQCLTGNADNYSRFCVLTCPDDPQSYSDTQLHICVYSCLRGQFSDNSTNLCVPQCPDNPEYYGDPFTGRCVFYCSQGLWAQTSSRRCVPQCNLGEYADNYTRRCVSKCPASQQTYGHYLSRKCLRVCPTDFWADNSTQECVSGCPDIVDLGGNTIDTYADNITHYCVLTCPAPNFGRKDTNRCVKQCPISANLFGHHQGRICVDVLNCYAVGGVQYYSDDVSRECVQKCPLTRWADTLLNKCVQTCPPSYYRNLNDQTCVDNCPTDPDEYADTNSLNCTRKCPNGYYAVVDGSGFRVCVSGCLPYGLIKDNITNRCVPLNGCPTQPYMFGDLNAGACVYHCSISYFADNRTQTCVYTCPAQWELFGSLSTYECVQLCDNYLYADSLYSTRPRTCRSSCSNGYFADNETSTCVQRCSSIKPFYYEDIPSGKCMQVCPGQSYAYNPNQTCIYSTVSGSGYVSNCPGAYFADPLSRTCVKLCPIGYYATTSTKYCSQTCTGSQYADNQTRTCTTTCSDHYFSLNVNTSAQVCVQFCPDPYYAQNSSKSCVTGCASLLALSSTRSCQNYCPEPFFAQWSLHKCVLSCNPKFADLETRTCITPCVAPSYSNPIKFTCDLLCPNNHFGRNSTRSCATTCLTGFADPYSRICVAQCPVSPMLFADTRGNLCVQVCLSPRFAYEVDRTCVPNCPNASGLVYLADSFNRKCVLQCTTQLDTYADYQNNVCTNFCPLGTFASNLTKQCVPVCDNSPNDTFSDNFTHVCMDICVLGTFGYAPTLNCVDECWWPLFGEPNTRLCVLFCPDGLFSQNETARCTPTCQPGTYADPTTNRCVRDCPQSHDLYKFSNWTCLTSCPPGYYANRNISECVAICNSLNGMYAYDQTNQCVMQCPYPYRGFDPNHTCITSCPTQYFYNISRNKCTQCPLECLTCTGPLSCLSCVGGYNLFNGECSSSCRPNGGIVTYAHPTSNLCVSTCPNGFYGNNQTYVCTTLCPTKQYGSSITGLCENCPRTCAQCTSSSYCTSCESNATMAIDNMCYSHCSSTLQYSYNNTCYASCPTGTFVSYTNVHCTQCSDLCKTCSSNASYCLSCYDRYLYNHACLAQCPAGYYGASDFTCQVCTPATSAICSQPLSFTTQVNIQNYQYVVSIKFNQQVSIQKQIQDILKVTLKVTRRLVSAADLINNGVSFTYTILSDGTIKLYLNIGVDLVNPVFNVRFTDPTAIVSLQNGASLQDIDSEFTIQKVQYYSPEDSYDIGIRKVALFTVVFILLLYCVTVLFTDVMVKPIQMLQIMFFHCICEVSMSASFFFFLLELKPALLQFLPNWMALPLAKDITLHSKSSQKTIDVFVDFNFFRNVGHIVFMIVVAFGLWALFIILSNRRIVENKTWHNFLEMVSIKRFRFSLINDILSVLYVPILWFGLNQFQQLFSTGYLGFNGFICLIFVIVCLLVPIGLFYIYFRKQKEEIVQKFPFMTNRLNIQKQKSIIETPATYLYLMASVIWLVGLDKHSIPQMILLIVTNAAYLIYLIVSRPFSIHVNTIFGVMWCALLMTIQIFLLFFEINNLKMTSSQKTKIAYPLLITTSVIFILLIIWSVWRSVWQFMDIWKHFKQSEFYKAYGDPQHQDQSVQSQVYNKYQKIVINAEPSLGDIIIQKVFKQCNEKGQNVIKVRKKVLKKKKKVRGRGKRPAEQQQQEEKQFVRINQVNPFDYDYDDDFKQKQKKQSMKRVFDDDLRQIMSEQDEKPIQKPLKKPSKLPKLDKPIQNLKKIKVDAEEKRMKDIDQILNDQDEKIQSFKQQSKQDSGEHDKSENSIRQAVLAKKQKAQPKLYRQNSSQFYRQNSGEFYRQNLSQFLINDALRKSGGNNNSFNRVGESIRQSHIKQPQLQSIKQSDLEDYKNINSDRFEGHESPREHQGQLSNKNQNPKKFSNHQIWENFNLQGDIHIQSPPDQIIEASEEYFKAQEQINKQQKKQQIEQKIQSQKPKGIQQLIQQQEGNKKKKLLFLFDEIEDD